ncbi:hypothetical protein K490DRAFT_58644 [Saccharata proteae CBS 121410]|uniref:Uncharacterized protein n=1 Tax=Saccharata proteae CBS 121410 TaxID=1314787 RepID=A0A9P4LY03_9PEZI|nr:hypothetical protein K490DRAFT_58644 [Saccharata proteae CBS 121410]
MLVPMLVLVLVLVQVQVLVRVQVLVLVQIPAMSSLGAPWRVLALLAGRSRWRRPIRTAAAWQVRSRRGVKLGCGPTHALHTPHTAPRGFIIFRLAARSPQFAAPASALVTPPETRDPDLAITCRESLDLGPASQTGGRTTSSFAIRPQPVPLASISWLVPIPPVPASRPPFLDGVTAEKASLRESTHSNVGWAVLVSPANGSWSVTLAGPPTPVQPQTTPSRLARRDADEPNMIVQPPVRGRRTKMESDANSSRPGCIPEPLSQRPGSRLSCRPMDSTFEPAARSRRPGCGLLVAHMYVGTAL